MRKITEADVGKRFRRRDGAVILLTAYFGTNSIIANEYTYHDNGKSSEQERFNDLVECLDDKASIISTPVKEAVVWKSLGELNIPLETQKSYFDCAGKSYFLDFPLISDYRIRDFLANHLGLMVDEEEK